MTTPVMIRLADGTELPPTLDTSQAAEMLGVSADHLYALVRRGEAPVAPLILGRALRWPTRTLLELVGVLPVRDEAPL